MFTNLNEILLLNSLQRELSELLLRRLRRMGERERRRGERRPRGGELRRPPPPPPPRLLKRLNCGGERQRPP